MKKAMLSAPFSMSEIKENRLFSEFGKAPAHERLTAYLHSLAAPHGVQVNVREGIRKMGLNQEDPVPYTVTYPSRKALIGYLVDLEKDTNAFTSISTTEIEAHLKDMGI